jgi:hypothetical protein
VFLFAAGIGPLPGGLLADWFGLGAPFLTYAATGAVVSALAWLRVPETKDLRRLSAVSFVNAVARTGALFSLIPILGKDRLSLTPDRIGSALALMSLVGLALVYPSGMLVDRYGRKPVIVPATLGPIALGLVTDLFGVRSRPRRRRLAPGGGRSRVRPLRPRKLPLTSSPPPCGKGNSMTTQRRARGGRRVGCR